jgi:hypothetical protein
MKEITKEELLSMEPYKTIFDAMGKCDLHAIPVKMFCLRTGLSDRALRKHIETMRKSGICIISDECGYYFPSTEEELERYIRRTEKTARSYFASLRTAKRTLRKLQTETQLKLPI